MAYWPALDGLRGLAVAAVLLFHGEVGVLSGGFLGVSLFFTLSGFLITTLLVTEQADRGRIDLAAFWGRRARRLLPALLLTLVGTVVFGAVLADPLQLARLRADALAGLGYVANWRFLASDQSYAEAFSQPSPVQHLWSLAIEEQFYLVFPMIVVAALRRSRRVLFAVVAGLAVASAVLMALLHHPGGDPSRVYYGTDTRIAELLAGALLALLLTSRVGPALRERGRWAVAVQVVGAAGLVVVLAAMGTVELDDGVLYEGGMALFSLSAVAVVAAAVARRGLVPWVLDWRALRALGWISYGTYLFHWPIFLWLSPTRTGWDPWPLFGLRCAVTLTLATLSYRYLEAPIRRGVRLVRPRRALAMAGVSALVVSAAVVAVTVDPPPPPIDLAAAAETPPPPPPPPPPPLESGPSAPSEIAFVPVGDISGNRVPLAPPVRVMVVGDSIAWSLGLGLQAWGERTGNLHVWNTATIGCGIGRGGEIHSPFNHCDNWAERWPAMLDEFRPDIVLVLDGVWDLFDRRFLDGEGWVGPNDPHYQEWLLGEYQQAVDVLTSRGATVAWLTSPCVVETDQSGTFAGTEVFEPERVRILNAEVLPELNATRDEALTMIDLFSWVCPNDTFTQTFGGRDGGRPDGLHFTEEAATTISDWLGPKLMTSPPSP